MKNTILSFGLLMALAGCSTLSDEGEKVHIEVVTKDTMAVDAAKKKLEGLGCTFVTNIEASVAMGSTPIGGRLIMGLKNKTAEVGGNAVISSLESNMGMPIYTKGIVYKCPQSLKANDV
jgi:hypothetical protein